MLNNSLVVVCVVPPEMTDGDGSAENTFSGLIISLICGAIRIGMVVVVLCPNSFLFFHLGTRMQLFYLLLIYQIIFRPPYYYVTSLCCTSYY